MQRKIVYKANICILNFTFFECLIKYVGKPLSILEFKMIYSHKNSTDTILITPEFKIHDQSHF